MIPNFSLSMGCGLLFYIVCSIVWSTVILPGKCEDLILVDINGTMRNCLNDPQNIPPKACTSNEEWHTWSKEFFIDCRKRLQNYYIKFVESPYNPKQACLVFPDLGADEKTNNVCIETADYYAYIVAGLVILTIIVVLDVIGIAFIIFAILKNMFTRPAPPPPPPPPPPAQAAPTVVVVQTAAASPSTPATSTAV